MIPISGVNNQVNPVNQPQKAEGKAVNNPGISFINVFEGIKRSLDGIMVVGEGNKASEADIMKEKLEVEKKRKFKTDVEEAYELLDKITKLMGDQDPK